MSADSDVPPGGSTTITQLPPETQQALASLQEVVTRAAEAARPILEVTAQAAASLAPLQRLLQQVAMSLRPALESGWLESFLRQVQSFATGMQVLETAMRNAEDLGHMGWTFPMTANLRDFVTLLLEVPKGQEAVDREFVRFYTDNGREALLLLLADLRQHERLVEFGSLLEEVAFGIDHEKYRLTVTALIPLFEGAARRCWTDGVWKGNAREQFFETKITAFAPDSVERIAWSATRAFVQRLYGKPRPLALNRHSIMHGNGPANASLVDCLRLLQAIHTVVSVADEEAEEEKRAAERD